VFYASEFRYAPPPLAPHTLTIGVTQSGETADTLAALAMEQQRRQAMADPAYAPRLLGVTNRPESSLGRLVDHILDIGAGIEVGVAATKTFLGQLLAFYGLALAFAERPASCRSVSRAWWPGCVFCPSSCGPWWRITIAAANSWPTCSPTPRT